MFQETTLVINKYEISHNEDIIENIRTNITNVEAGSLVNIEFTLLKDVEKLIAYGRFNIPENSVDREYKKEVLQSVVDIDKLFRGVATNFIARTVIEEFGKTMNFERKFPIKKGLIKFTNATLTDQFFPSMFKKALLNLRYVGKLSGSKKMTFMSEYKIYIEIK